MSNIFLFILILLDHFLNFDIDLRNYSIQICCSDGGGPGYQAVINHILPVIAVALEDEKPEVGTLMIWRIVHRTRF